MRPTALREADLEAGRIRAGFDPSLDAMPQPRHAARCSSSAAGGSRRARSRRATSCRPRCCSRSSPSRCASSASSSRRCRAPSCRSTASTHVTDTPDAPACDRRARRSTCPTVRVGIELRDVAFAYEDEPVLTRLHASTSRPGEIVARRRPDRFGQDDADATCWSGWSSRPRERSRSTAFPRDRLDPDELRAAVSLVFQESFLFADDAAREHRPRRPAATADRSTTPPRSPASPASSSTCPRAGRRRSASAASRSRVASASASRSPAPSSASRSVLILDDATSAVDPIIEAQILGGLRRRGDMTTGDRRPPVVDHQARRPGRLPRGGPRRRSRHPPGARLDRVGLRDAGARPTRRRAGRPETVGDDDRPGLAA